MSQENSRARTRPLRISSSRRPDSLSSSRIASESEAAPVGVEELGSFAADLWAHIDPVPFTARRKTPIGHDDRHPGAHGFQQRQTECLFQGWKGIGDDPIYVRSSQALLVSLEHLARHAFSVILLRHKTLTGLPRSLTNIGIAQGCDNC